MLQCFTWTVMFFLLPFWPSVHTAMTFSGNENWLRSRKMWKRSFDIDRVFAIWTIKNINVVEIMSAHSHLTKKKQDLQGNRSGLAAPTVTTWLFNASIFVVGSMTAKPCLQKHRWRILHYTWCFVCSFKAKTKRANSTRYSGSGEICLECFFGRWMMNLMKVVPKFLNSQLCYVLMSVFCMFENVL